MYDNKKSVLT